jgi:hypothetical protein
VARNSRLAYQRNALPRGLPRLSEDTDCTPAYENPWAPTSGIASRWAGGRHRSARSSSPISSGRPGRAVRPARAASDRSPSAGGAPGGTNCAGWCTARPRDRCPARTAASSLLDLGLQPTHDADNTVWCSTKSTIRRRHNFSDCYVTTKQV